MMPSSIFKSICVATAILASPTAAQIGNWDILYQSLEADFQDSVTNEITLDYLIGAGRTFNIDLFNKDCISPITGMTITPTTARLNGVTADHDGLEIMLDLDKSAITSSNIWEDNKLEFCVRVQLLSGGSVIKEDKRDIDIAFDFTVDFEAVDDTAMQTASMTSGSGQASVDSYVKACKCTDIESFTCDNTPLAPNSILNVCIQSIDSDVEISFLASLELFQDNILGDETLLIVDALSVQNSEISSLTIKNATAVGVSTVVPSRFFSYAGLSTATVSGIVQMKLVGPTRRGLINSVTSSRVMRGDETVARPASSDNDDATPFEITIGMEPLSDISYVKTGWDATSSGTIDDLGAVSPLLIIFGSAALVFPLFW